MEKTTDMDHDYSHRTPLEDPQNGKMITESMRQRVLQLLKQLLQMALPIWIVQECQMMITPIALVFCGHLGDEIGFDGASLAISVINCTVFAAVHGLSSACDTLFSQTIHSKNKALVGQYLQKAVLIFSLFLLPIFVLHVNLEKLLRLFGQNRETSRIAGQYVLIFIPGAWSFCIYLTLSKYLLSMDILYPNIAISAIANGVNAVLHYVLLYQLDMGIRGSAVSITCTHVLNLILILAYIRISGCYKDTWTGWSSKCLQEWGHMIKLAVSGMLTVGMEWWAFELGIILAGTLGTTELGSQAVLLQLNQIWFQAPLSIMIACSIRVGQWLGAGDVEKAKLVGWIAMALILSLLFIPVILFIAIPRQLVEIFTTIPSIVEFTSKLLPLVAVYLPMDGITCALKGVLTGTGRQMTDAIMVFISYYVIGLPIGISLMFTTDLGVIAYWIGLVITLMIQSTVLLIIVPLTDWNKQKKKAFERNKRSQVTHEECSGVMSTSDKRYKSMSEN